MESWGWSLGSHVVRHARDNQCSDVIVTVSPTNHGSAPFKPASLGVSKWKLGEFHRTLAWLQFGLDHWEARIRAVGRALLGVPLTLPSTNDQRIISLSATTRFLVSLVASRHRDPWNKSSGGATRLANCWHTKIYMTTSRKRNRFEKAPENEISCARDSSQIKMVHEWKSDNWEDADSAFWFIEPRYAGI